MTGCLAMHGLRGTDDGLPYSRVRQPKGWGEWLPSLRLDEDVDFGFQSRAQVWKYRAVPNPPRARKIEFESCK